MPYSLCRQFPAPGGRDCCAPRESAASHNSVTVDARPTGGGKRYSTVTIASGAIPTPALKADGHAGDLIHTAPGTLINDVDVKLTPSSRCDRCAGTGKQLHPFPHQCRGCHGSGLKLLPCLDCEGFGDLPGGAVCEKCNGRGVRACVEPRCTEDATHSFTERGYGYDLCPAHFAQWKEDAEA